MPNMQKLMDITFRNTIAMRSRARSVSHHIGYSPTVQIVQSAIKDEVILVSGFARGIDIALHKACLKYEVPTIAVLAGGFRHIYPYENARYVVDLVMLKTNTAMMSIMVLIHITK